MLRWTVRLGLKVAPGLVLLALSGCELPKEPRASILMIAVEGLNFETLSCDSEEMGEPSFDGVRVFCDEAVRFTHAFAPSTMTQATMASLLTGLYPMDHGVRHNGADFLSSKYRTLAEGALSKNYRTLFISGGPPLWRKSGLAQGFEIFDDSLDVQPGNYYRPAKDVFRTAQNWIEQQTEGAPFLSVLYLADLQFSQIATRTNDGELREKSAEAQIAEVAEALGGFTSWLKARKKWNRTNIVLVGLNSLQRGDNDREPSPLSLKAAGVQVSLFVKPARREGDNVIQWAIDRNVSLVDVGRTLFDWLGVEPPRSSLAALEPESLVAALKQSEPKWEKDRLILSETAWPDWLEGSGVRTAVRQNQFLYVHDQRPLIYNTLTDRMETIPLKVNDPLWVSLNSGVLGFVREANLPPWKPMQSHWLEQIATVRGLWHASPSARWSLRDALAKRDWKQLKKLSQAAGDPIGTFVASRQMGESPPEPRNACVRMLLPVKGDKKSYISECDDERALALHNWQSASSDDQRQTAQDRFLRLHSQYWMDQEIGRMNYLNELRWDVDREWPEPPRTVDLILTLKELEPFEKKASGFLRAKNLGI